MKPIRKPDTKLKTAVKIEPVPSVKATKKSTAGPASIKQAPKTPKPSKKTVTAPKLIKETPVNGTPAAKTATPRKTATKRSAVLPDTRSEPEEDMASTHDDIARTAHAIYLEEGSPHGRDQEHWHAAKARLSLS